MASFLAQSFWFLALGFVYHEMDVYVGFQTGFSLCLIFMLDNHDECFNNNISQHLSSTHHNPVIRECFSAHLQVNMQSVRRICDVPFITFFYFRMYNKPLMWLCFFFQKKYLHHERLKRMRV